MNLPAVLIIILIAALLVSGTKESARINNIIVVIKLSIILLFILLASPHVKPVNWTPFMPFGIHGVITGAAIVFLLISALMRYLLPPKR